MTRKHWKSLTSGMIGLVIGGIAGVSITAQASIPGKRPLADFICGVVDLQTIVLENGDSHCVDLEKAIPMDDVKDQWLDKLRQVNAEAMETAK